MRPAAALLPGLAALALAGCGDKIINQTVATVTAPASTAAAAPAGATVHIGDMFRVARLIAPRNLMLWASDALDGLTWTGWGSPTATARGRISEHFGGKWTWSPTDVAAGGIGQCGGTTIYTSLTYTFHGETHSAELGSNCRFTAGSG